MIDLKYVDKFYDLLLSNYDTPEFNKKITSFIKGFIKNGGKANDLIYEQHHTQKKFYFLNKFNNHAVFINLDIFKYLEERGMTILPDKFLSEFYYNKEILSYLNDKYIEEPLDLATKENFYYSFVNAFKFGMTDVLPILFSSKGKDCFFQDKNTLIKDLSYYLYWNSYDDKNENAIALVIFEYYKKTHINLMPLVIEDYRKIILEKEGHSDLDSRNKTVINTVETMLNIHMEKYLLNDIIEETKMPKTLKIKKI